LFHNIVRSDGFTVDFLFSKKGKANEEKTIENHRLTLEDFDLAEIEAGYRHCFIDPVRKDVFTAAIGLDDEKHQVRSYRFHLYQGRKRAADKMVNMLINGGTKYNLDLRLKKRQEQNKVAKKKNNKKDGKKRRKDASNAKWKPEPFNAGDKIKVPLIVFGNGMFGKDNVVLKSHRCGTVGVLWRALKQREVAGDLLVLEIDEFKTSRIRSCCSNDTLERLKGIQTYSILVCKTCHILWNRDINASKN
ncbi:hypothetical protein BDF20DRAFT_803796, partial [Mycotypha africana]|uniref:uncharacterized protein n=1 Tax=Mycotypha africana TaxID=64632 RepID=UPI002300203F